jgi:hypothetical protein
LNPRPACSGRCRSSTRRTQSTGAAGDPVAPPCYAIAATIAATTAASPGDLKDRLLGDGLVPLMSALSRHKESARDLKFAPDWQWIADS